MIKLHTPGLVCRDNHLPQHPPAAGLVVPPAPSPTLSQAAAKEMASSVLGADDTQLHRMQQAAIRSALTLDEVMAQLALNPPA